MGAFILFPVLLFSVFITAVMGFADFVHVSMEVHAAAQNAAQTAAEVPSTTASGGVLEPGPINQPIGGVQHVALSYSGTNAAVRTMLQAKPITGYSCNTAGSVVTCQVHFSVDVPIVGQVNGTTSASSSSTVS